jgi:uncharacterized membrane protein
MNRNDLHLLGGNSDLNVKDCQKLLEKEVYSQPKEWRKFIRFTLLCFGIGFLLSGIIFFFAYNWDDIDKISKIIITQSLVPIGILIYLRYTNKNKLLGDLGAISATIMVGVSYAVYGQIYQTGANDFDFFMNWSLTVFVWVVLTNINALWLIYLSLLNITLITYHQQYMIQWTLADLYGLLFILNTSSLILFTLLAKKTTFFHSPDWFITPIALASIFFSTTGISSAIHSNDHHFYTPFLIATTIIYALGIYVGYASKRLLYLGSIYFSLLIIFCSFILDFSSAPEESLLLFLSFIVVAAITVIVMHFLKLQKKWNNEG